MTASEPFKWRHFQSEIILLTVRWHLRYSLSYRDLEKMMLERGERCRLFYQTACQARTGIWIVQHGQTNDHRSYALYKIDSM